MGTFNTNAVGESALTIYVGITKNKEYIENIEEAMNKIITVSEGGVFDDFKDAKEKIKMLFDNCVGILDKTKSNLDKRYAFAASTVNNQANIDSLMEKTKAVAGKAEAILADMKQK